MNYIFTTVPLVVVVVLAPARMPYVPTPAHPAAEKALQAYCAQNRLEYSRLESCKFELIPRMQAYRYRLPPTPDKAQWMRLHERYAFVFVDLETGRLVDIKRTDDEANADLDKFYALLFAELKRAGRKATTNQEAECLLRELMTLEDWLWSARDGTRHQRLQVRGPYRGRPNTYGAGVYSWCAGDDLGLEVDSDGYATRFLGGHIR
jgi:hypothetical protein